jgi:hypothetical protein
MTTDAALLAAARSDPGAFRELYDRYAARVLGYHLRRTCDDGDVEYHCTIDRAPTGSGVADLKGTVEPTVDASKHVNGGCRSLRSDGREWEYYIGRAAVAQQIIGAGFLGEYAPSPGQG